MDIFERLLQRIIAAERITGQRPEIVVMTEGEVDEMFASAHADRYVDLSACQERVFACKIVMEESA